MSRSKPTDSVERASGEDGSMDTILASIRRILNEDEVAPAEAPQDRASQDRAKPERANQERGNAERQQAKPVGPRPEDDVLVLGEAMMVPEKIEPVLAVLPPPMTPAPVTSPASTSLPVISAPPPMVPPAPPLIVPPAAPEPAFADRAAIEGLVAARTRAATAQSFDALNEALLRERPAPAASPASPTLLRAGGPTIEELVRDELRMLLSNWLDVHLPVMVEGMVRAEIEKLTRR